MKYKAVLLATICSIGVVACGKTSPLLENNKEFIGQWKNETSTLTIEKDGNAKYMHHTKVENKTASSEIKASSTSDIKAPITEFDTHHFQVGQGELSQNFTITKAPYKQEGKWKVVLNNEVYTKD